MKPIVVHCQHSPYDVYVGRGHGSPWGNPFSHHPAHAHSADHVTATRAEAIEKFEHWLFSQPDLVERAREELRGKTLGCWCTPRACHGDVLARVANDWPAPDLSRVICFDVETDARMTERTERLGVQPLVCMAYSIADGHASLVDAEKAIDLWLDWVNDDSVMLLTHAGYTDMAVMAQAAYLRHEGKDCVPGTEWAYEVAFRAYDADRVIDTEIRQRLTQIAFGPSKGSAQLGSIVSRVFEVDLGDAKKVPEEAQALLSAGTPWEQWPQDVFDATPWRVKYGALERHPLHTWPRAATEYPKGDVLWPRAIFKHQHDRWQGRPIPDEQRQTRASWDLHLLARPGWRSDRPRAEKIRELYRSARINCRRKMVADGVIKQKVVHRGKECERVDESVTQARVKQLVYQSLGDETPLAKKARENLGGREPTPEERLAGASRSAATIRKAIIAEHAKVLDVVDAIDKSREGAAQFDQWLAESGAPSLNAIALHTKATTYITNFLDRLVTDARVRTSYQTLVDTGRVSSRSINIQQIPRDQDKPPELSIRGCFIPDPGWAFVVADYEQLELCALAHILSVMVRRRTGNPTYESTLSKAINSGRDCHVAMAATLLSADYDEVHVIRKRAEKKKERREPLTRDEQDVVEHRQIAKAANFGFPGGQGPKTYIEYAAGYGLTLTMSQSVRARAAYLDTWTEMPEYFSMMDQACERGGGVTTLRQLYSGRIRGNCKFTKACNGLFQSLAADGAKEALHLLIAAAYRDVSSPLYRTRPSMFVHDEFHVASPIERAPSVLPEVERLMVLGMSRWIPDVKISAPGKIMVERWSK